MLVPNCPECHIPMEPTNAIGTRGYYCPAPECTAAAGPQYVLTYAARGARGLVKDAVCGYTIKSVACSRCGLRADFGNEAEEIYHTMPGGCRP